ncbi:tRNA (guanine(37)-N1)-methyltransferase [Mycena kentingensis (nom. inval.)]|nr:tRNA (guanine(37)-N1)-methyltransferase [Mycena kentingensis (nom. inval.)]
MLFGFRRLMSTAVIDFSPPSFTTGLTGSLDRSIFKKFIPILAARFPVSKLGSVRKAPELRGVLLDIPRIQSIHNDPSSPTGDTKLLLLKALSEEDIPAPTREYLSAESDGLVSYTVELGYDYWSADDLIHAIVPEDLRDGSPAGFSSTGHIAHVNLKDEYLPYKHLIGQILLDKNKAVKTVVNKLDTIDTQFRFFKMELLAGEPDYVVEHYEADCRFTFDFTQVYWNSRLHTEHERLVELFNGEDVVADVFAGVGPFAIPAAKKGCAVLANDLNPNSAKYLAMNVNKNRVDQSVRVSCEDGREFIQTAVAKLLDDPLPPYKGPKKSKTQQLQDRKNRVELPSGSPRNRIAHFVMNLPDSAITFLDAFRGILNVPGAEEVYRTALPTVHCHCFTRETELEPARRDILQRVEEKLGSTTYRVRLRPTGTGTPVVWCTHSKLTIGIPVADFCNGRFCGSRDYLGNLFDAGSSPGRTNHEALLDIVSSSLADSQVSGQGCIMSQPIDDLDPEDVWEQIVLRQRDGRWIDTKVSILNGTLRIVQCMPDIAYYCAANVYIYILNEIDFLARKAGKLTELRFAAKPTMTITPTGGGKQPDGALWPKERSPAFPTVIVEVGYTESVQDLYDDVDQWCQLSEMSTQKIHLIISVQVYTNHLLVEFWTPAKDKPATVNEPRLAERANDIATRDFQRADLGDPDKVGDIEISPKYIYDTVPSWLTEEKVKWGKERVDDWLESVVTCSDEANKATKEERAAVKASIACT